MEELTKRNGKGVWMREIEKMLRRFDASLEWLIESVSLREQEMDKIRGNTEIQGHEKDQMLKVKKFQSIKEVLEEVEVLIDTHFFNGFYESKSSLFLKRVFENRGSIEMRIFKKTWRSLNCSPKTMKIIREVRKNILCVGKRKELITKKKVELKC